MTRQTRPRLEEFLLAVLWTISAAIFGYFGIGGYFENLAGQDTFILPGFIISFIFICLMVFGLRFAFNVYLRIPANLPPWLDSFTPLLLGITLLSGFVFSWFTVILVALKLFDEQDNRLILAWGFAASGGIIILSAYQVLAAVHALEPFLIWLENQDGKKAPYYIRWLVWLNRVQHFLSGEKSFSRTDGRKLHGPLLTETDLKTTVIEEKPGGRPGLEKTLVGHGGWHVSVMGFTSNASVIFASSDGGFPHFQAGGRKGVVFPPEIKFWEWRTGKVQTAPLGPVQTFMTRNFQVPSNLQNFVFLVPSSGGKFAWAGPKMLKVGDWQSDEIQTLEPEEELMLKGQGGFTPVAINPEGNKIAWCDIEGQTHFWDLETNRTRNLRDYPNTGSDETVVVKPEIWGLSFSPDGTKIATIGKQGVQLQNVFTGWRWFAEVKQEAEKLTAFAFNHDGFEMAVGLMAHPDAIKPARKSNRNGAPQGENGNGNTNTANGDTWKAIARLWDLRYGDYTDLVAGDSPLSELSFSPDNRLLVAVDETGVMRIWNMIADGNNYHRPRLIAQLDLGMTGRKTVITFSPDMERLISATDNRVLIWNLAKVRQEWSPPSAAKA